MRHWTTHLALALTLLSTAALAQDPLEAGFKSPPNSAKPHTWWHWINGNITKAGITADLEAMKRIGLGGAQVFNVEVGIPEGDTPYNSPQWHEALAHAFKEAKRLGLEICIHNCAGWSSSGGPWIQPDHAMQILTWTETAVHGPSRFDGPLPQPSSKLGSYHDIAVYAVRNPKDIAFRIPNIRQKAAFERGDRQAPDLVPSVEDATIDLKDVRTLSVGYEGRVTWDVPEGDWTIIRIGHTPTGKGNHPSPKSGYGPEVDKLSREAMDEHWAGIMVPTLKDNGPISTYGLNNALIDSYEVGSQNWTPDFQKQFKARCGYDPLPYLPVMTGRVVQSREVSERFLWDVRKTVSDLFADNYFGYFKELCHKNGLLFSTEGYGNGSFDNLRVCGMADIPMGEFWVGGGAIETTKLASSAAHTNGKKVVGAESFTADDVRGRWLVDPYSIKALGDRVFTLGINRYIFHRYAHQPWMNVEPGMTMGPWGMNLDRTITWWDQGAAWMAYIARCQFLLQSGRFVADVVAFTGEEAPNDLPMLGGSVVPTGYDYDGCDASVLMQMKVENGQIVLPTGMRYRVLLLPDSTWMTPATLKKVAGLVQDGATVVGPMPKKSPSLADLPNGDAAVAKLAAQVWGAGGPTAKGEHKFGKGRVVWGADLKSVLTTDKVVPDLDADRQLNWIHRTVNGTEVYFVANPAYRPVETQVSFRVSGKTPEVWNPETGETMDAAAWQAKGGRTIVPLRLESAGSVFVVFRRPAASNHLVSISWLGERGEEPKPPKIEILEAHYEAADGNGGTDVTKIVKDMVAKGEMQIPATNALFGDPTVNRVKRLRIVYTSGGKKFERSVEENGTFEFVSPGPDDSPPDFLVSDGSVQLWRTGKFRTVNSRGVVRTLTGSAAASNLTGAWDVAFQAGRGAPATARFDKLESWPESKTAGIKYFSGTATYRKTFDRDASVKPGEAVWLDLGKVKNFADIELNGHRFPTLWKTPFRLDVTKWLKRGANTLSVGVTNLWPNRLIGDEAQAPDPNWKSGPITTWPEWVTAKQPRPKDDRVAFATWKFYGADSPLMESGLIGPVKLIQVTTKKL